MKIAKDSRRVLPALAGRIRGLTEPVIRELEGVRPARAPDARSDPQPQPRPDSVRPSDSAARRATLTGWSTTDLMAAVREAIKSGRAVARGRFLNIRI